MSIKHGWWIVAKGAALGVAILMVAVPGAAQERELRAYRQALDRICVTGVTPEIVRLYEAAVTAVDAAKRAPRQPSNVGSPRPPDLAYEDCYQKR